MEELGLFSRAGKETLSYLVLINLAQIVPKDISKSNILGPETQSLDCHDVKSDIVGGKKNQESGSCKCFTHWLISL